MEAHSLFEKHRRALSKRVDREFACLMLLQWIFAVYYVLTNGPIDPFRLWITVGVGALIFLGPTYCALFEPGNKKGAYVVAAAQMGFSSLFIYILGGRMEAHFYVFGSLTCLAAYRDWRVMVFASSLTIIDHLTRTFFYSPALYAGRFNFIAWVFIEGLLLCVVCVRLKKEMECIVSAEAKLVDARVDAERLSNNRLQFVSVVSHEIQTPLHGIIALTDFLKKSQMTEEQNEYVRILDQCSGALLELTKNLLDFTKIDGDHIELEANLFQLADVCGYLEGLFQAACQKKNLKFKIKVSDGVPESLLGDSYRLRQVLTNLVSNAIKFTEAGQISVTVTNEPHSKNFYRWTVQDTGVGIKEENIEKIFHAYVQEDASTARKYGGTGLGLAISKRLVEVMGGHLHMKSDLGKGTQVYFTVPL